MKRYFVILSLFTAIVLTTTRGQAQNDATPGFSKLKSLAGEWEATGLDGQLVKISYQIISGGSAVMETRVPDKEPSMVSVFHLDDGKLVMSHYCSAGNQPRMQADAVKGEIKGLNFTFLSITNLTKASDGHMHHLAFTFHDKNHVTQVWTWRENGKEMPATFELVRKR